MVGSLGVPVEEMDATVSVCYCFILTKIIYLKDSYIEQVILHSLVHVPYSHNDQSWPDLKPGAWSFSQVSHTGGRGSST